MWRTLFVVCSVLSLTSAIADEPRWGNWSLKEKTSLPAGSVIPSAVRVDAKDGATFDGASGGISIPLPPEGFDATRFRIACSIHTDAALKDDLGTILSLWDAGGRTGFQLSLRNNTGCTSSQANWRQLEFGIDAGTEPIWRDEGRPGDSLFGFAICAHAGELYVASCEADPGAAGRIYRYGGTGQWTDLGTLDGSNSVTALATYDGSLYAATGKYRLGGSSLSESQNDKFGGRIYRLDADDQWTLVGELPMTEAVAAMTVYDGSLYASSLYHPAGLFRHETDGSWKKIPTPNDKRVQAMRVHDGWLYLTSYDGGRIYRFDGEHWEDLGNLAENTQTYSFAGLDGKLWVGTWPSGRVYELAAGEWLDRGRLGEELEVMAMGVYNGAMYAGTLPLAEAYRYDGGENWTRLKQLDETPDVKYRRAWSMANFRGRAYYTTLPSGHVWSMSTGGCVTNDHELSPGWHDLIAERNGDGLTLSVDGQVVAQGRASDVTLPILKSPLQLKIGDGPNGTFLGKIRDLRIE